jgi:hypothetical protein
MLQRVHVQAKAIPVPAHIKTGVPGTSHQTKNFIPGMAHIAQPFSGPAIQLKPANASPLMRSRGTIQLKPNAQELYAYCDAAESSDKGKGKGALLQVQAMAVGDAVIISANQGSLAPFVSKDGKQTTVGTDTFVVKAAADPAAAGGKIATGGIIVLAPGELHAEQNLLLALAHYLQSGGRPGNVIIAGRADPCATCKKVLNAFALTYAHCGFGTITHRDMGQGQARSVGALNLRDHFRGTSGDFKTFVDYYSDQMFPPPVISVPSISVSSGSVSTSSSRSEQSQSSGSQDRSSSGISKRGGAGKKKPVPVVEDQLIVQAPRQSSRRDYQNYLYAGLGFAALGAIWGVKSYLQLKPANTPHSLLPPPSPLT